MADEKEKSLIRDKYRGGEVVEKRGKREEEVYNRGNI